MAREVIPVRWRRRRASRHCVATGRRRASCACASTGPSAATRSTARSSRRCSTRSPRPTSRSSSSARPRRGAFCAGADLRLADAERAEVSDLLYELYGRMTGVRRDRRRRARRAGRRRRRAARDRRRPARGGARRAAPARRPGHGLAVGAWALPSLVGRGRAMDLCLSMRPVERRGGAARSGSSTAWPTTPRRRRSRSPRELAALDPAAAARVKRVAWASARALEALEAERAGNRAAWTGSMTRGAARG